MKTLFDGVYAPSTVGTLLRYHRFLINTDLPVESADITHRQHAIIEIVFADLIDGPLVHIPSGRFGANSAWVLCAAIATTCCAWLARWPETVTPEPADPPCAAGSSTLRPGWRARNADRSFTYPRIGPGQLQWLALWHNVIGLQPTPPNQTDHPPTRPHRSAQESWHTSSSLMPTPRQSRSTTPDLVTSRRR